MTGGNAPTVDLPASDRVDGGSQPRTIGRFAVLRQLGEGGMGVVYEAYDADLDRRVAIKLVRGDAESPGSRARLVREAAAMARVEHPNVVRVYEIGEERGRVFIAMELVDGATLHAWLRERRSSREVLAMFAQAGAGLAAVHRDGLVHRDFKPDNVLVDRNGRARVADFGLVRLDRIDAEAAAVLAAPLTHTGALLGTPGYMAPEQLGGGGDARADQFSFCAALREALGGGRVAGGDGGDDARWNAVPRALRAAIARGLAYAPGDRFASMDELNAALGRAQRSRARRMVVIAAVLALGASGGVVAVRWAGGEGGVRGGGGSGSASGEVAVRGGGGRSSSASDEGVVRGSGSGAASEEGVVRRGGSDVLASGEVAVRGGGNSARDSGVVRGGARVGSASDEGVAPGSDGSAADGDSRTHAALAVAAPAVRNAGIASVHAQAGEVATTSPPPARIAHVELPTDPPPPPGGVHELARAHLPAVRAAVHGLGYIGVATDGDPAALQRELDATRADDLATRAALAFRLGAAFRRAGDCAKALAAFSGVLAEVAKGPIGGLPRNPSYLWSPRAELAIGLCELETGHAVAAMRHLRTATLTMRYVEGPTSEAEHAEALLADGIAVWETGDRSRGSEMVRHAAADGSESLRRALEAWARAVGATLT